MLLKNKKICYTVLFLVLVSLSVNAQTSGKITGKIYSANKLISDVHIINLNNRHGTISNSNGEFEINISIKDSLLISSIQYQSLIIGVTKEHLKSRRINIHLKPVINELDEVFLHDLSGNLTFDLNNTPKDTMPKHNFRLTPNDFNKKLPEDIHGFKKPPNALSMTDPTYMGGASASATLPDFQLIALRKLKRELRNKKEFPSKIKQELGLDFFTITLKIPKEKINHFLSFCEYRKIIDYHNKNNLLEVIKILREESKNYHEIKNEK